MEYRTVTMDIPKSNYGSYRMEGFEKEVNRLIESGYKLSGGISISQLWKSESLLGTSTGSIVAVASQALVK